MRKISGFVFLLVLGFLLFYGNLPVLNYGFTGFAFILLVIAVVAVLFSTGYAIAGKPVRSRSYPNQIGF